MQQNLPNPAPVADKICVLYNSDGLIVHTHREVTYSGGQPRTDDEVEKHAKAHATKAGHDISALSTMQVRTEDYDASAHRVDVAKKRLVSMTSPQAPARVSVAGPR
jgi:hypothetical protein